MSVKQFDLSQTDGVVGLQTYERTDVLLLFYPDSAIEDLPFILELGFMCLQPHLIDFPFAFF